MVKFITKKIKKEQRRPIIFYSQSIISNNNVIDTINQKNNEEIKPINDMNTKEKIEVANEILKQDTQKQTKVKKVTKDRGLIERTESSKILLTEDNKELLMD